MSIKERLLSIGLLEKLQSHPEYAKALRVKVCGASAPPGVKAKEEEI